MKTLILAALIAFSTTPAQGYWKDGIELFSDCIAFESKLENLDEMIRYSECQGYIQGYLDGQHQICNPTEVTLGQFVEIALKHLREKPETRHRPAALLLEEIYVEVFPCD